MPAYWLTSSCIWNSFQNSNKKHIIITGNRGAGKSTLLHHLFPNPLPGITTWAVPKSAVYLKENGTDNVTQVGVYDASLEGYENKMVLCSDGFASFGIRALNNALLSDSEWISIDEVGYLESQCSDYLNIISQIMDKKHVLVIVRKQNLPHIKELSERDDVFLIDLDTPFGNMGCVIMASGLGKRFGENKLMAKFHGKPLISYILDATSDIFEKRIVVTRHESVANLCKERNIDYILHTMPHRNDTIRLGLEKLLDTEHTMFCTSDQPLLTQETIAALALLAANAPSKIIRPICDDIIGSPVVFPKDTYDDLLQLSEGKGGGYVIKQHPSDVQYLPIHNANELKDIDTQEDFLYLQQLFNQ